MISKQAKYATLAALICFAPSAFAKDACETVLCMWGKLQGGGVSAECAPAVQDYFSIIMRKRGKIRWDPTSIAREAFLNSCPTADRGATKLITSAFGKLRG